MNHRVLIVEDEFLIRLILADALNDAGYEVAEAANGDEAVDLAAGPEKLALLVTDINMPGKLDGHALAQQLRQTYPNLPIVYTSGRPDRHREHGAMQHNEEFVSKPYTPAQIVAAIKRLLHVSPWSGREDSNLRP